MVHADPDGLPDDWVTQITRAYQIFGVDSSTPVEEFGVGDLIRGAQRYWTAGKRKAKALRQSRNEEGEWVEERGNIPTPINLDPRGNLHAAKKGKGGPRPAVGGKPKPAPRWTKEKADDPRLAARLKTERARRRAAKGPVRVMDPVEAEAALTRTGEHPFALRKLAGTTVITRDGNIMAAVPNAHTWYQHMQLEAAEDALFWEEQNKQIPGLLQSYKLAGRKPTPEAAAQIAKIQGAYQDAIDRYTDAGEKLRTLNPDDPPDAAMMAMAEETLDELEDAVARGAPKWRLTNKDGTPAAFAANLDPAFFRDKKETAGITRLGTGLMTVNPHLFNKPMNNDGHMTEAPYEKLGLYTVNHEFGHMVDDNSNWDSALRPELMDESKSTGETGRYAESSIREALAEAMALRQFQIMAGRPLSPFPKMFEEAFGWDQDTRPDTPTWTPATEPLTGEEVGFIDIVPLVKQFLDENGPLWGLLNQIGKAYRDSDYPQMRQLLQQLPASAGSHYGLWEQVAKAYKAGDTMGVVNILQQLEKMK